VLSLLGMRHPVKTGIVLSVLAGGSIYVEEHITASQRKRDAPVPIFFSETRARLEIYRKCAQEVGRKREHLCEQTTTGWCPDEDEILLSKSCEQKLSKISSHGVQKMLPEYWFSERRN